MSASKGMPYGELCWKRNLAFLFVNNDLTRNRTHAGHDKAALLIFSDFSAA
jgi:hypothetical protein